MSYINRETGEEIILPKGWNKELEIIFKDQMDDYLGSYSDYYPTREKVINEIEKEFNRLKLILNK